MENVEENHRSAAVCQTAYNKQLAEVQENMEFITRAPIFQSDHSPGKQGKPGKVREFQSGQGKVRENEKSQGKVRGN